MLKALKIALGLIYTAQALIMLWAPLTSLRHLAEFLPVAETARAILSDGREMLKSAWHGLAQTGTLIAAPLATLPHGSMVHEDGHGRGDHEHVPDKHPAASSRRDRKVTLVTWRYHDYILRKLPIFPMAAELIRRPVLVTCRGQWLTT